MIKFKHSVRLRGIRPEMVMAHTVVASVYADNDAYCMVTSGNDSRHGSGSLHFSGGALDYRTHHLREALKILVVQQIKDSLGPDYDVLLEGLGTDNEHLHCEYQPKHA